MSRFQWRPDSVYAQNSGFLSTGILNAIANGPIAAGELCTLFESGAVRRTDQTLGWDIINRDGGLVTQITETTVIENIVLAGMTTARCMGHPIRCLDLSYIIAMQTSAGIGFCRHSSSGAQSTNFLQVSSDSSNCVPYVIALANGNVATLWHVGSSLKFAVHTPQGVQIVSPVTVETSVYVAGLVPWHGHCLLPNGNIALSWCTTSGVLRTQIFETIGGTAVTAVIQVDTSINGGYHGCTPCANGDFLISCFDGNHSLHKMYRLTNVGVISWGPKMPSTATAPFGAPDQARMHPQHMRLIELPNGNIAWVLPGSSSNAYANIFVLSALGVLVKQCDFGNQYHDSGYACPITLTPAGFACFHGNANAPNTYGSFFDFSGNNVAINVLIDSSAHSPPAGSAPVLHFYCGLAGASICINRYVAIAGSIEVRAIHCDHRGVIIRSTPDCPNPFNHLPFGPNDCNAPIPHCDVDGMVFTYFFTTTVAVNVPVTTTTNVSGSSVVGVAQNAAANGAAVTVVANGYFTPASTQNFTVGSAFDRRGGTPNGCRGTVGPNGIVLFGWV
jgi:hypothetical protein